MDAVRRMRPALGTFVEAGACGGAGLAAIEAAFSVLAQAQELWSFQDPASELSRINASDGGWIAVHPDSARLLRLARGLMTASGGYFNFTIGGAQVLRGSLPDHGGRPALACGTAQDVELRGNAVRLRRPVRLVFDGIAKGFAVDLACRAMRRAGAAAGWINAGGDLRVFGGLDLPLVLRGEDGAVRPCGTLRNAAFATSQVSADGGDTFPADIIAPAGSSPQAGVWSVLARSAWRADALTKVAATAPASVRAELLERLKGKLI
ncbi:FAD:protein FMN transferase [Pseudoduganella violaceinigra]|uniref:FAD:protein FMN transferase n=1 Tax=Pseudoduganella violaceinigra TaxID=246602 RepID=UPI000555EB4C|nr:FAD:protein FMN transferase [Pseudoduganella violaceinigra]